MALEMTASVEIQEGTRRKLAVSVPSSAVRHEFEHAYEGLRRGVKIKGFRPGKVPLPVLKNMYGGQVREEVLSALVRKTYAKALADHGVSPVSDPEFDLGDLKEESDFAYTAVFEVKPDVEAKEYTGLEVEIEVSPAGDAEVEQAIERLRKGRAKRSALLEVRPARNEDWVVIDFDGTSGGKPIEGGKAEGAPLQLGMGAFLKDLEDGIVGMKPGETREIPVKFPEDYFAEALRGADAAFKVVLKEIQKLDLPDLDDAFAKSLGGGLDTVEKLRARVRDDLAKAAEEAKRRSANKAILDKLLERNPVPCPEGMLKKELDHMAEHYKEDLERQGVDMRGKRIDMDRFRAERGEEAARRIRISLLLEEIADQEGFPVTDEELRARVAEIARGSGQPFERVMSSLERGGHLHEVRQSVLERKVLDFLRAATKVVEKPRKTD